MSKERVAILTTFQDFNPGYSLTGIVSDQYRMLKEHGHPVTVYTCSTFNKATLPDGMEKDVKHLIPFAHLTDYKSQRQLSDDHKGLVQETATILEQELKEIDIVLAHDFVFTGWNLPYGLGVIQASRKLNSRFFHWIHSIPSKHSDWWNIKHWGGKHRLIYPNKTDMIQVAEQFRSDLSWVRRIHHIKDLRTFWDFHEDTCKMIDQVPAIMQAGVVKVYPASVDRLTAKRVKETIMIMSEIKKRRHSVCLIIAAQWATEKYHKESIENYYHIGKAVGLEPRKELYFTSDFENGKYSRGVPHRILRELMLCSNLFMFLTKEETFGLVLPEACLCGVMPMMNRSLELLREISDNYGLFFPFGSFNNNVTHNDASKYYKELASIIMGRMERNESLMAKTHFRRKFNYDYLYDTQYEPAFAESKTWK